MSIYLLKATFIPDVPHPKGFIIADADYELPAGVESHPSHPVIMAL